MDEDRDGCRHYFRPLLQPLILNATSVSEAALLINRVLWNINGQWNIYFKPNQTPDIMSPTEVCSQTPQVDIFSHSKCKDIICLL